jgi:ethanolamine utilization protein EutA
VHEGDGEHYHDIGERVGGYDDIVVWTTAGLDVGSSTSQVVFSRITLAREDSYYRVIDRTILHESEIMLTPYRSHEAIDQRRLSAFIERQYALAQLERHDVDTGAVILTGLALTTSNARAVAEAIADESGKFVAVAAGDILEARLAANGAGVPNLSRGRKGVVVHIDIGGGTTKISAWQSGELLGLAALDVGARLVTFDESGVVTRIEAPARGVAADLHLELREGRPLAAAVLNRITGALARNILRYAGILPEPPRGQPLLRTAPVFRDTDRPLIEAVIFSGGVSEYVYGREKRTFGDLGLPLGRAIRAEIDALAVKLLPFERGIRATVLGVSQHSVQLSGNTIFVSRPDSLPLRNVPVLLPRIDLSAAELDRDQLQRKLSEAIVLHGDAGGGRAPALAIQWQGSATFERLDAVARSIAQSLEPRLGKKDACVIIVEGDVAGVLGARLERVLQGRRAVICLDGIHVHEFDHIDLGSFAANTRALPVIVKSLLFSPSTPPQAHPFIHARREARRL